jgi:spore maturation protein CgeB
LFQDLLTLMADSACVLCPLPHMTGFHERALGAFTAGAAVIAAPNRILETEFRHTQDMFIYRSPGELADMLPSLVAEPDRLQAIARSGQDVAHGRFAPRRLAQTLLSTWRLVAEEDYPMTRSLKRRMRTRGDYADQDP